MVYAVWLFFISIAFVVAERLWPWRPKQKMLRRGVLTDLLFLVFNAEYLGILVALAAQQLMRLYNLDAVVSISLLAGWPDWLQFIVLLLLFDFLQWCVHNALHRIPFLWRFHKVHHSIEEMDWVGDWRFHWGEIVVYRSALYLPIAMLGFAPHVMFWYGILNTIVGHYAHANIRLGLGPLKYLFNTPQMHIWHHTHPDSGPVDRNFGITLSVWDWIFGTAFLPRQPAQPERLGFAGIERYPKSLIGQWIAPFIPD